MTQLEKQLEKLLSVSAEKDLKADHFFCFSEKSQMEKCARRLLALGFATDLMVNLNKGVPQSAPLESEEERSFRDIAFQQHYTMGLGNFDFAPRRREKPYNLVCSKTHSMEMANLHDALEEYALTFDGRYNGHGFMVPDDY